MSRWVLFCLLYFFCDARLFAEKNYIKLIDRISLDFSKELVKEQKMSLSGEGGRMMNDIEEVMLAYNTVRQVSIDEARRLFLEITDKYLSLVNNDLSVRPFLHNYPFTIDNLDISIGFIDECGKWLINKNVALVSYSKKHKAIFYTYYDTEKEKLIDLSKEPYEEARRLVMEGK